MADFKPFGSLRSVIDGVDTMATKYLNLRFKFGGILVSEVGPVYVGGKTEYVENVDEDHLSIPELADYAKSFGISKLGKTYVVPSLGGDLVEFKNDMDICFQQGCRRCIGLDGCFLKGICKGQLLVVVAKDANNQMYPITWVVIGTECKLTWKWFITILQDNLNLGDGSQMTIISDMQKGLIVAANEVFPECVLDTY
ncbi:hypothetical protein KY284_024434 [Solanum tuberosum]|nr:hypothetical protein KY284_024434 [Solanum tuberosum]